MLFQVTSNCVRSAAVSIDSSASGRLEAWRDASGPDRYAGADVTSCGQSVEGDEVERVTMDEIAHVPGEVAERCKSDAGGKGNEVRRDPGP